MEIGTRVSVRGYGRGVVIGDSVPPSRFYVTVKYDLDSKFSEKQLNALIEDIKILPSPKLTREEKYFAQVETIRSLTESYFIAGQIVQGPANIHVSTPPEQLEKTIEELDSFKVDYEIGKDLSVSSDKTCGRSYSVVMNNPNVPDYESLSDVRITFYMKNEQTISIQAKQFVLNFLLGDLHFKLGKFQDVNEIRKYVPEKFSSHFERGYGINRPINSSLHIDGGCALVC